MVLLTAPSDKLILRTVSLLGTFRYFGNEFRDCELDVCLRLCYVSEFVRLSCFYQAEKRTRFEMNIDSEGNCCCSFCA